MMKAIEQTLSADQKRQKAILFWRNTASIPFIYGTGLALIVLDIGVEIYHRICFPLYGIERVDRRVYIKIDRGKLIYLNWLEKFNCIYCGYANGLMGYSTEIIAQTERYWCAIKHDVTSEKFNVPEHHKYFSEYGSGENPSLHLFENAKK